MSLTKIRFKYHVLALIATLVASLLVSGVTTPTAGAVGLTVATIFKNYAVLQRNMPVPVWGTAGAGTQVTVSFQGQVLSAAADSAGKWQVNLAALPASATPSTMTITGGGSTITVTNIQVGEVWVASGQSNIAIPPLSQSTGGAAAIADSVNYNISFYKVGNSVSGAIWERALPGTVDDKSAVAYYFVRELARHQLAGIPIGVYQAGVSGTAITQWTTAKGDGSYYKSRIVPIQPYAMRGVFWYQGETDGGNSKGGNPDDYNWMLPALINEWRADWGQGPFPFLIVQLPWWQDDSVGWAKVRDAQLTTWLSVANTGMAVTNDMDLGTDIHPVNKEPIGYRMSLHARALVYGDSSLVYSGPIRDISQSSIQGNQIVIGFNHVDGGLVTNPVGSAPGPFKVAGTDGIYYDATAQIVGNTVVVSSPSVPNPASVQYVWSYARGNLYNAAGLPASPFQINLGGPTPTPGPSATPTRTNTPASPTNTPTRTNTPTPTNTPTIGPSPTPTNTATPVPPTNTPTRTNTPAPTNTPGGSTVMHVADIYTTDSNGNPQSIFVGGTDPYWRVKIVDQSGNPVEGASVTTDVLWPTGGVWVTRTGATGTDGWVMLYANLLTNHPRGVYTINVTNVIKTGATYDPAANVKSSTTFTAQ